MIGDGVVLITYGWLGWRGSMWALATGTALPVIAICCYREPPSPTNNCEKKTDFGVLIRFFRRPGIWHWISVLLVFRASNMINYGLVSPILVDLGWSLDRIGFSLNIVGPFFGIACSALAGWIVGRWGRKPTMLLSILLMALAMRVAEVIGYSGMLMACIGLAVVSFLLIWRYDGFELPDPLQLKKTDSDQHRPESEMVC